MTYSVTDYIPHRAPVLFVDKVIDAQKDVSIHAQRIFTKDDPVFEGHFPGHPVLPGVLGVEALAQTGALLVNISLGKMAHETLFFFMSIEKTKFRLPIYPDDVVDLHVRFTKRRGFIFRFDGEAIVNDKVAIELSFTAKLEELTD